MLKLLLARLQQGHRTLRFPDTTPALPDRFRGRLALDRLQCRDGCRDCVDACPTAAITQDEDGLRVDLGRCLFCNECVAACPEDALQHTQEYRLAARTRAALVD